MLMTNRKALYSYASIVLFLMILCLSVTGCNNAEEEKDQVKFLIGMSQANLIEPWRIVMNDEIKQEALKHKDTRIIFADAAMNSQKQIKDVKELLDEGIDLLIISPNEPEALLPIVNEAYKRIPVIVLDRAIEGYNYTLYIGPDNLLIGKKAGQFVSQLLGDQGGSIIEISGLTGSPPVRDRSLGFRKVIEQNPKIKIIDSIRADWMRDIAEDKMKEAIAKYPKIDVIFAQNDPMALGAYLAATELGVKDIKYIGVDGLLGHSGGLELVKKDMLEGTFTCRTGGKEAVQYAIAILNKEKGIPKKIILRSNLITKQNMDDYLSSLSEGIRQVNENERKLVLGFAQVGEESSWRLANSQSIKEAARDFDIELKFTNAKSDQGKQIQAIRSFIRQKVDVIAFSPLVETGWDEVLKEAKDAGIPVICSDRGVNVEDDSLYTTFLGADFVEEGRRAARWLLKKLGGNSRVNIVELQGTIGSAPAIDRKEGFEEILREYPAYKIIESESGDFTHKDGKAVMANFLKKHGKEIQVVYAHNDDMALGAIEAIEEYGLKPGKDIIIVSIDGVKDAFKAMLEGKLNCTIECNPLLGPQLMKAVKDICAGKEMPIRIITDEGVFPEETAIKEYPRRSY